MVSGVVFLFPWGIHAQTLVSWMLMAVQGLLHTPVPVGLLGPVHSHHKHGYMK